MKRAPFYEYSSFNKRGGKVHPAVARTRNRVLDAWQTMNDYDTICEKVDVSRSTVVNIIKQAKADKDPRAIRAYRHKGIMRGETRRRQIEMMHGNGLNAREIAKRLKISPRLVQIRLKEKRNA